MKKAIRKLAIMIAVLMTLSTIVILLANKQQDPIARPVHKTLSLAPLPRHEAPKVSLQTAEAEVLNLPTGHDDSMISEQADH